MWYQSKVKIFGREWWRFPKKERISKDTKLKIFERDKENKIHENYKKDFLKSKDFWKHQVIDFLKRQRTKYTRTIKRILVEGGVNYFQCFLLNPFFVYLSFSLQCVKETN